jgi:hypothetical protein
LDALYGMGVVTGVVTEVGGGADTMSVMPAEDEQPFDFAALAEEKRRSREEDRRALASGEKSLEELRDENEVFAKLAARARVNLAASESLS